MKSYLTVISIILVLMVVGCQQSIDIDKEKEAIIKVINEETAAYVNYDFEALAKTHLHDTMSLRLTAGRDNYVFLEGWVEVAEYLKQSIEGEEAPENRNVMVKKSNYRIKVYPQSAWVVCDEKWIYRFETDTIEIKSIQVRFMEKIDEEWKIAFLSMVGTSGYDELDEEEALDILLDI